MNPLPLVLDGNFCDSLDDIKKTVRKAEIIQSSSFRDLRCALVDGTLESWLQDGDSEEQKLAEMVAQVDHNLTDDALILKLQQIFTGSSSSVKKPPYSDYLKLRDIKYQLSSMPDIKAWVRGQSIVCGDDDNMMGLYLECDVIKHPHLCYSFKVDVLDAGGKPIEASFAYNANLSNAGNYLNIPFRHIPLGKGILDTKVIISAEDVILAEISIRKPSRELILEIVNGVRLAQNKRLEKNDCSDGNLYGINGSFSHSNNKRVEKMDNLLDSVRTFEFKGVLFNMINVEGGSFMMGSTHTDYFYREPSHKVTLSRYYIGETLVTQKLWKLLMNSNPSRISGDDLPVEHVSWEDCQVFISKLNQQLPGKNFRLPTEAEWEFAARGGKEGQVYEYAGSDVLREVAWYEGNSGWKTHSVANKQGNELGLYDMSGNVWEWCLDWFGKYTNNPQNNPKGPTSGKCHVMRGGCLSSPSECCSVSYRSPNPKLSDFVGFRLVLMP